MTIKAPVPVTAGFAILPLLIGAGALERLLLTALAAASRTSAARRHRPFSFPDLELWLPDQLMPGRSLAREERAS
jgi:hypothetical protein